MLRSIARKKFIDRPWTTSTLNSLGAYWLRLCKMAADVGPNKWVPKYTLELRLSGFPRAVSQQLKDTLDHNYRAPELIVTAPDPDTFVVTWKPADRKELPAGLGFPLILKAALEGLVVEIRLAVANRTQPASTSVSGHTLVLVGEFRDRALIAKTIWGGRAEASEGAIWNNPTPWEEALISGFDEFCADKATAWELADALSFPPQEDASNRLIHRLVWVPFGRPRLWGLLLRCSAFVAGLGVFVLLICLIQLLGGLAVILAIIFAIFWCLCLRTFIQNEFRNFRAYTTQHAQNALMYRRVKKYIALTPEHAASCLDDPYVHKYTSDVLAAGFIHVGDVASVPLEQADMIYRIFHTPTRGTYSVLICHRQDRTLFGTYPYWPATVSFECQTFFSDGGRVDSVNHDTPAPPTANQPASTRLLEFPEITEPLALYQAHIEAVEVVLEDTSATAVRHEPFDVYLRRQEVISEEEHAAYVRRPYSLFRHLRWYLQLDAKPSDNGK